MYIDSFSHTCSLKKYKSGYFSFVTRQSFESGTKIFPPQTTKNWPTLLFLFRKKGSATNYNQWGLLAVNEKM